MAVQKKNKFQAGNHHIKAWRKKRRLTQKQVCERMEISPGGDLFMSEANFSRIETGEQQLTEETLLAIAHALDVDPGDLISNDPFKDGEVIDLLRKLDERDKNRIIEMMKVMVGT